MFNELSPLWIFGTAMSPSLVGALESLFCSQLPSGIFCPGLQSHALSMCSSLLSQTLKVPPRQFSKTPLYSSLMSDTISSNSSHLSCFKLCFLSSSRPRISPWVPMGSGLSQKVPPCNELGQIFLLSLSRTTVFHLLLTA